jgi:IclR family acetate operon transcriptional repressor
MKILTKVRSLLQVVAARPGVQLPELARALGMPKSTVHRLLRTLVTQGFLEESGEGHGYRVGPLVRDLASGEAGHERLIAIARPRMLQLRDACNETVALHVLEGSGWMTLEQIESTHDLRRTITNLGTPMPLHAAATGKLFLAYMAAADRTQYLDAHELTRYTPNTLTSRRRLLAALEQIRREGYALSVQEMVIGVAGISMPVMREDRVYAAVGVSGPLSRFTPKAIASIRAALKKTTQAIERDLVVAQVSVRKTTFPPSPDSSSTLPPPSEAPSVVRSSRGSR